MARSLFPLEHLACSRTRVHRAAVQLHVAGAATTLPLVMVRQCMQAARDYGALPDAEAVRMARSGEGAGQMPLSADMLERLLPQEDSAARIDEGGGAQQAIRGLVGTALY